jgi:hypothetical protein
MSNISSLPYFIPELVLSGTAIVLLLLAAAREIVPWLSSARAKRSFRRIAVAGLSAAFVLSLKQWGTLTALFS